MKTLGVACSALVFVVCFSQGAGVANASMPGLNERPANLSCIVPDRPGTTLNITSQRVFPSLSLAGLNPTSMSQPPGDPSRWLIASRGGEIYSFANDNAVSTKQLVLDITDRMQFTSTDQFVDSQQYGVMSFALHPQFPTSPFIYVAYNAKPLINSPVQAVISRFTSMDGGVTFDSLSEQVMISVEQSTVFHHVGQILFGLDEYLYIGLGDGGISVSSQPSQDLNDLRGSILRIDVNQGLPYAIPPDNPLVGTAFRQEIYAYGFRNPWRFSFDRDTGELWLGDLGGVSREEANQIYPGGNYGWPVLEGTICRTPALCDVIDHIPPVLEIAHPEANGIIGGYVYRGTELPALQGTYIFGDAVEHEVRGLFYDLQGGAFWDVAAASPLSVSSFAEAIDGEIYFIRWNLGTVHKLAMTGPPMPDNFPALLSETGCVDVQNPGIPASGLIPYSVNAPLWSDGAEKDRWMALPDGETIDIMPDGDFAFPIGTVLMKTFLFDSVPVETRLFMRHDDGGWGGYSYEWNNDLTDAVLLPAGKTKQITPGITWTYPSRNQCMQCHTDVAGFALGPEVVQLNGKFLYQSTNVEANQLDTLAHIGLLTNGLPVPSPDLLALSDPSSPGASVEQKARSYLHANCSGCHRPQGPVQSAADFRFSTPVETMSICDVLPNLGDLGVIGAKLLSPGAPDNSIISLRMNSLDLNRMPPLGTAIIDPHGTDVVDAWISQPDVCVVYPDTDLDLVRDNVDNCTMVSNPDQRDSDNDGIGNVCDPDFDQNCIVNFADLAVLRTVFFTDDEHADLNGDGDVNFLDTQIFAQFFLANPGPGANGCQSGRGADSQ